MPARPGFIWTFESCDRNGQLIERVQQCNLMPTQGLNHWIDVLTGKTSQVPQWHIGLYMGDYTPIPSDKASDFPSNASEFTGYDGATRKQFTAGVAVDASVDNELAPAEFTFTTDATVRGGFIISSSGKGATSGVLLSALRLTVPKPKEAGEMLRVYAHLGLISD